MAGSESPEIERSYAVTDSTPIPPLCDLPGVARVQRPQQFQLYAAYFDTPELLLAGQQIALRRRTGGDDAGWHLTLPVSADERIEIHEPLGSDPALVPVRLRRLVEVHLRGRTLSPVATLSTRRTVRRLRGPHDEILALFCDDTVESARLTPTPLTQSWREWELELVDGNSDLLDDADSLFASAGAPRSDSPSTLATALGDHAPRRALPAPPPTASAGELLIAALGDALRELVFHDPRVREDLPDAVHRMRVAVTRIRAGLGTFPSLLSDEARSQLRPELAWLGRTLGSIRDHDVVNRRLTALLRAEPADLVLGPIAARMEHQFGLDFEQASAELRAALDSERYFRLLDTLEAVVSGQWLAPLANSRAKNTLSRLLNHRIAALRRAMRRADAAIDSPTHDLALHEVRKQAKRVRYAALVISPLRPKRATRLVTVATALQDSLGDHQDSVIARQRLLRLSADAHAVGENTLSYGRLHAIEQSRGEHSEAEYEGLRRRARQALARD